MSDRNQKSKRNDADQEPLIANSIPEWLTVETLESELFDAIVRHIYSDLDGEQAAAMDTIDAYFAGDDGEETESERRINLLKLLGLLHPQLAELFGGPRAR